MIRVVLDTNVLVSAVFWGGIPSKILDAWQEKKLQLIFTDEILTEYIRVGELLLKKYPSYGDIDISQIIELITVFGELSQPVYLESSIFKDPDDDKFIACALGADCEFIVSGDKDLLEISGYEGVIVLKPSDSVRTYL